MLSSGLIITNSTREECVYVSSIYDTNLNDSVYTLSLTVSDTTVSTVIVSNHQANLTVYTTDLNGMFYCNYCIATILVKKKGGVGAHRAFKGMGV